MGAACRPQGTTLLCGTLHHTAACWSTNQHTLAHTVLLLMLLLLLLLMVPLLPQAAAWAFLLNAHDVPLERVSSLWATQFVWRRYLRATAAGKSSLASGCCHRGAPPQPLTATRRL